MEPIENQDDQIADEEEIFGSLEPIAPLSPIGPLDLNILPNDDQPGDDEQHKKNKELEKKKRECKPRVLMNLKRLDDGKTGWPALPKFFKDVKFRGKGHEKEDLDFLLQKYEEWAQKCSPRHQFIDVIDKIESFNKRAPSLDSINVLVSLLANGNNNDDDDDENTGHEASQIPSSSGREAANQTQPNGGPAEDFDEIVLDNDFDDMDFDDITAI